MYRFYNEDCIEGAKRHLSDSSIDLIITDPPYGIEGDKLHRHYHRKEEFVVDGYVEIPKEEYAEFTRGWVKQAERVLKPGGSLYVISGYTNLHHILNALHSTELIEVNHLIWKYNFGVHTTKKFVSSHYHILFWVKPGKPYFFNTYSRFGQGERDERDGALNYQDREDVWIMNREYKPGEKKNKNELPTALLIKMMQYSSNIGDTVCDFFLGGFSTATVAKGLSRGCVGFEVSESMFELGLKKVEEVEPRSLIASLRRPRTSNLINQGKSWSSEEKDRLRERYIALRKSGQSKRSAIQALTAEFHRGRFSIGNVIDEFETEGKDGSSTLKLDDF
jgi:site-specific DNA-methyltransferase (adenine-specific)